MNNKIKVIKKNNEYYLIKDNIETKLYYDDLNEHYVYETEKDYIIIDLDQLQNRFKIDLDKNLIYLYELMGVKIDITNYNTIEYYDYDDDNFENKLNKQKEYEKLISDLFASKK